MKDMRTSNDPIGDFLTRIRNASMALHNFVEVPYSNIVFSIAKILEKKGYIRSALVNTKGDFKFISVELKYCNKEPAIRRLLRVSKPGRRVYVKKEKIPNPINGLGLCILSTSKGILTGKEAIEFGVGGEVLCEIW